VVDAFAAEQAAERLADSAPFKAARTVKINPDAPQRPLRLRALLAGKRVLVPTPRLRGGFYLLDPSAIPPNRLLAAASISGFDRYGQSLALDALPPIDHPLAAPCRHPLGPPGPRARRRDARARRAPVGHPLSPGPRRTIISA